MNGILTSGSNNNNGWLGGSDAAAEVKRYYCITLSCIIVQIRALGLGLTVPLSPGLTGGQVSVGYLLVGISSCCRRRRPARRWRCPELSADALEGRHVGRCLMQWCKGIFCVQKIKLNFSFWWICHMNTLINNKTSIHNCCICRGFYLMCIAKPKLWLWPLKTNIFWLKCSLTNITLSK